MNKQWVNLVFVLAMVPRAKLQQNCEKICENLLSQNEPTSTPSGCDCFVPARPNKSFKPWTEVGPLIQMDNSGIYFEPAEVYPQQPLSLSDIPFFLINPAYKINIELREHGKNNFQKRAGHLAHVSSKNINVRNKNHKRTEYVKVSEVKHSNNTRNYLDIGIADFSVGKKNTTNEIKDIKITEDILTTCIDLHILQRAIQSGSISALGDKFQKYENLTDTEILSEIEKACSHISSILRSSVNEITEQIKNNVLSIHNLQKDSNYKDIKKLIAASTASSRSESTIVEHGVSSSSYSLDNVKQSAKDANIAENANESPASINVQYELANDKSENAKQSATGVNIQYGFLNGDAEIVGSKPNTSYDEILVDDTILNTDTTEYTSYPYSVTTEFPSTDNKSVETYETSSVNQDSTYSSGIFQPNNEDLNETTTYTSNINSSDSKEAISDASFDVVNEMYFNNYVTQSTASFDNRKTEINDSNVNAVQDDRKLIKDTNMKWSPSSEESTESIKPELPVAVSIKQELPVAVIDQDIQSSTLHTAFTEALISEGGNSKKQDNISIHDVSSLKNLSLQTKFEESNATNLQVTSTTSNVASLNTTLSTGSNFKANAFGYHKKAKQLQNEHFKKHHNGSKNFTYEINGKFYFEFGDENIPAHFVQDSQGEINISIDGKFLCDEIKTPGNASIILTALCNCVTNNNCTTKYE